MADAWREILANVPTMGTEQIALSYLSGRVLAEPIHSPIDLPIFTNSAVDGYAIDSASAREGTALTLVGTTSAGDKPSPGLSPGQAHRVFTGSPLPPNADTVVMQEDVEVNDGMIMICKPVKSGSNVRHKGEELAKGALVFDAGALINPAALGVLATLGLAQANVYKRPRIAIIGTGNELVSPGAELQPGQIYESNTYAVSAAVTLMGGEVVGIHHVKDRAEDIDGAMSQGLAQADVVITCGGVSVGEHDLVRASAEKLGVAEIFWRVAMRPGKPFYFGLGPQGQPVFGLPGNPVSALVTFFVLIRPALRKMVGLGKEDAWIRAELGAPIKKQKGREEFVRAISQVAANLTVVPTEGQGSHMLTGLSDAEYLIHLPEFMDSFANGDVVTVKKLHWGLV